MKLKCTCNHKGQDELHGEKIRVFNKTEKKSGNQPVYRCTVCLAERSSK